MAHKLQVYVKYTQDQGVLNFQCGVSVQPEGLKIGAYRMDCSQICLLFLQFEVLELKFDQILGVRTELSSILRL